MAPRCREYRSGEQAHADIVICADLYAPGSFPGAPFDDVCYMQSGKQFYTRLLRFDGMMLHASAVALENRGYLFSGPCGVGKSTHTRLWQKTFGEAAQVFNDDKPALRCLDGRWFAYGTPWSGKHEINQNRRVPLAGICFLKQGLENRITRLDAREAVNRIVSQTLNCFQTAEGLDLLLEKVDRLVRSVPVYELENDASAFAAQLSYETMTQGAKEAGL